MYGTFPGPVPQPPPEPGPQNTPKPIAGHREHHLLPGVQPTWNLRLESTGGHIPARFLVESPLAATLVTEDLCWQAATEDWKNRRPRRWRPRARAAWQAEGDELASEAVRLQEMADYVFREL